MTPCVLIRSSLLSGLALALACRHGGDATPAAAQAPTSSAAAPAAAVKAPPPEATSDPDVPQGAAAARDAELAKLAAPFVDAFVNSMPSFTPDGKKVVFISSRDGLPQAYVADAARPDAPAVRLVTLTERVGQLRPTPDGKQVLFTSDHGADENWSMFRVDLDGNNLTDLSPGETLHRDAPIVSAGTPKTFYYSARKVATPASALYSQPIAGGTPKKIYDTPGTGFLLDVDPAGKRALWLRRPSRTENYVDVVDLATGTMKTLFPAGGPQVSILAAKFSADGKRVYVNTDGGGEQGLTLALDARTGKELARYVETRPATATMASLAVAKKGNRIAVKVNAGNHDEIRLLDARTLKPAGEVSLPLGSGAIGERSDDGKRLPITWSTPSAPTDLRTVDVKTGKTAPLRSEGRPSLPDMAPIETSVAEVKAFDGQILSINVYLPARAPDKKLPVIVEYHGGPAGVSTMRWSAEIRYFVLLGYAIVEPNVRGSSGFGRAFEMADNGEKRLDAFKDIETTGRWAAAQPWADPARLVISGGSYGGYTVLIGMTRNPELWRAGVNLFGIVNLRTFLKSTSGVIRETFKVEFGDLDKDGPFLDSISPITDVDKISRPLFVYAGANDPRVPRPESDQIVKALRARGVAVEYMVADDEGHSLARRNNQLALCGRVARFLETQLR